MMSVAPPAQSQYSETERMELRRLVRLASEIIAYYWPMRTFVHHNPLHGLEDLPLKRLCTGSARCSAAMAYLSNANVSRLLPLGPDLTSSSRRRAEIPR